MDPEHLLAGELEEEFAVRYIQERGPGGLKRLREALSNEDSFLTLPPPALPSLRASSELRACNDVLESLKSAVSDFSMDADDSGAAIVKSRCIHLQNRVRRLESVARSNEGVQRLVNEVEQLKKYFVEARASLGSNEAPADRFSENGSISSEQGAISRPTLVPNRLTSGQILGTTSTGNELFSTAVSSGVTSTFSNRHDNQHQNLFGQSNFLNNLFAPDRNSLPLQPIAPPNSDAGIISAMMARTNISSRIEPSRSQSVLPPYQFVADSNNFPQPVDISSRQQQQWQQIPNNPQVNSGYGRQNLGLPREGNANPPFQQNVVPLAHNNGNREQRRPGNTYLMSKWNLKFNGNSSDLPVAEFLFRVETLARSANIDFDSLPQGMHYVLHERAEAWYWVHLRDNQDEGWRDFVMAITNHFSRGETQIEIREKIYRRKQRNGEAFANFFIDVSSLASRLTNRMLDGDMVEILRANMCSQLKHALLFQPTPTTVNLLDSAKRCERLWESESAHMNQGRVRFAGARVSEIEIDSSDNQANQVIDQNSQINYQGQYAFPEQVDALNPIRTQESPSATVRSDLIICWNCDDIGHYHDACPSPTKNLYCYGCGEKNVYKDGCPRCNSGNGRRGGHFQGNVRPQIFHRAPNTFQRK